jgi:hypothetical protein
MAAERRAGAAALASLLLALLAPCARAQLPKADSTTIGKVDVSSSCAWPSSLSRGYVPVRVELVNRGTERANLTLEFRVGDSSSREVSLHETWSVAPITRDSRVFTVPLLGESLGNLMLSVRTVDDATMVHVPSVDADPATRHLLFVTDDPDHALTTTELEAAGRADFARCVERVKAAATKTGKAGSPPGYVSAGGTTVRVVPGPGVTSTPALATVFTSAERLPLDASCYTSVDAVVVDRDHAPPTPEQLDALLAWVRAGGRAAFLSKQWATLPAEVEPLRAWDEPRFLVASHEQWRCLRVGSGRVLLAASSDVVDATNTAFDTAFANGDSTIPMRGPRATSGAEWPAAATLPDVGAVPRQGAALTLLLFVVLIGPVNSVVLRRRRKPLLSLATIPGISLAASLLILGCGTLRQGLDVKVASRSLALLDQRSHRAATTEQRELFAGLVGGRGLTPAADTWVSPFPTVGREGRRFGRYFGSGGDDDDGEANFVVDATNGRVLSGSFLPARTESRQLLTSETAARERLEFRHKSGKLEVVNGLGARIERLLVCDGGGRFHATGAVDAGASALLDDVDAPDRYVSSLANPRDRELYAMVEAVETAFSGSNGVLPAGGYVARLESSPFTDATGLKLHEVRGLHHVVGVFDPASEEGR